MMNRRESLKALAIGTLSAGLVLESCAEKEGGKPVLLEEKEEFTYDRQPEEIAHYEQVTSTTFFSEHETATIIVLGDIIIPKDEVSGSASDAKVHEFIEFIVKDIPEHQIPMRGGLRWLDLQCLKRFEKPFKDCTSGQQLEMVNMIAYPLKAKPEYAQGVAFFNLMRNLTATGFYTSEIGVKDIGYAGNTPNQWKGVPVDVLEEYQLTSVS